MATPPRAEGDPPDLTERPAGDELARKVARSKIAGKLFAKHEPVKLGRYHLLEQVGAGGMGIVWGAWDPELDRRVAIKLVKTELARARERIVREGQALAKLSHPNVVPIYDVGVVDDQVYLVMEWVRGENLRAWAEKPRTPREIAAVYRAAAQGLAAAHAAGLIHRDFKPENAILGEDGRVRVLDFGLALDRSEASDGARAGTPKFMAPEQLDGEPVPASDQFAVGTSLLEALGKAPPRWLVEIIERATAPAADARYPSMDDLVAALGRDPAVVWRRRIFVAAALALAGGAFAIGTLRGGDETEPCTGGASEIAGIWNLGTTGALTAHLRALGPYGSELAASLPEELAAYAGGWTAAHRSACQAHQRGELTQEIYAANLACLSRARVALSTTRDVLAAATSKRLPDAVVAARALPMVEGCALEAETSSVSPPPQAIASSVAEVSDDVVRARTLALAVEPSSLLMAESADRAAVKLGYAPLIGRAALVHGLALLLRSQRTDAMLALDRAAAAALEARDGITAVEAIARKLFAIAIDGRVTGRFSSDVDTIVALAEPLAAGLQPTGGFARALFLNNMGTVRLAKEDRDGARQWFQKALRVRPRGTHDGIELASIVGNLGLVESDPAKRDAYFRQEGDEIESVVGRDHPLALDARIRAAMFIESSERAREALSELCGRYARLHAYIEGRQSQCSYELAWLAEEAGDLATARRALAQIAPDALEAKPGAGYALLLDGKYAEASKQMLSAAEEYGKQAHFWSRWRGVDALIVAARAQEASGQAALARETLERALVAVSSIEVLKPTTFYQRRVARIHAMLARLGARGEHKQRALAWYRTAGGYDREVAALEALTD